MGTTMYRNSEGYTDITAGKGAENAYGKALAGEIWTIKNHRGEEEYVIVLAGNKHDAMIIYEAPETLEAVAPLNWTVKDCGVRFDCFRIGTKPQKYLLECVQELSAYDFTCIRNIVCRNMGVEPVVKTEKPVPKVVPDNKELEDLRIKLFMAEAKLDVYESVMEVLKAK